MKTNELRACPFCGEKTFVKFVPLTGCTDIGNITCVCGFVYTTISQGLDDWNTRPIEDGLQAEIEELKKQVDELIEKGDNFAFTADDDDRFKKTLREWNEAVIRSI